MGVSPPSHVKTEKCSLTYNLLRGKTITLLHTTLPLSFLGTINPSFTEAGRVFGGEAGLMGLGGCRKKQGVFLVMGGGERKKLLELA